MTAKTRLAKIEKGLTPQQVVLAYLDEIMRRFSAFLDWTESAVGKVSEAPLIRVGKAVREAMPNTTTDQPKDLRARTEEGAVQEAVFLVKLFLGVNDRLLESAPNYGLQASLCARSLQVLLLQEVMAERDVAAAKPLEAGPPEQGRGDAGEDAVDADPDRNRVVAVRDPMWQHLGRLYLHEFVIDAICGNYFGGHAILFPAESQRLGGLIETAEALVDEYNNSVSAIQIVRATEPRGKGKGRSGEAGEDPLPIEPEDVKRSAAAAIRQEVTFFVRMVKAETLILLGQNEEGCNLAANAYRTRYQRGGQ